MVVVDYPPKESGESAKRLAEEHARKIEVLAERILGSTSTVTILINQRSRNMSGTGCWNTGIMQALAGDVVCTGGDFIAASCSTFVAILDDDDEWKPSHLSCCLSAVAGHGDRTSTPIDWVVCGIERNDGGVPTYERATAETLTAQNFLRGNPGVQGSNLFVRLPLLLRAGCFDENLDSMTDRDIVLRSVSQSYLTPGKEPN